MVALKALPVPARGQASGGPQWVFAWPEVDAKWSGTVRLGPGWDLSLGGSFASDGSAGVFLDPHPDARPAFDLVFSNQISTSAIIELIANRTPPWELGDPETLHVIARGARLRIELSGAAADPEFLFSFATEGFGQPGLQIEFGLGAEDDFLPKLLGTRQLSARADFSISYSTKTGWRANVAGGTEIAFAVNLQVGPVWIGQAAIALASSRDGLAARLLLNASGQLWPGLVRRRTAGFLPRCEPDLPRRAEEQAGGLSPVAAVQPPGGVGLAIDASVVVGGGHLFFDSASEQYAGILDSRLPGSSPSKPSVC